MAKEKLNKNQNLSPVGAKLRVRPHFEGIAKEKKGITLIALIITIIVMLILVGVTINVALNGGLFNTANEATIKAEKHSIYDQIIGEMKLKNNGNVNVAETYEAVVDILGTDIVTAINPTAVDENTTEVTFTVAGKRETYTYKITEEAITIEQENAGGEAPTLTASNLLESNYTLEVEIEEGTKTRTITIPQGFGVVDTIGDAEALIDDIAEYETYITEANIENGIVIQDEIGNEFVWIPVDDINSMVMCQSANTYNPCTVALDGDILKCTKHNSEALAGRFYTNTNGAFNANLTGQTYDVGIVEPAVLSSYDTQDNFTQYGGGTYSNTMYQTEFNLMATSVAKIGGFYVGRYETGGFNEAKVVSKPDRGMDSAGGDINETTWYKMYKMQKDFGNDAVGSSMIWGCQYDQVMKFVDGKNNFSVTTANDSRHSGSSTTGTGNTPADFVANIYDLEGNMQEWTLEGFTSYGRVFRGGYYSNSGSASYHTWGLFAANTSPTNNYSYYGSRLTLYVQ